MADLLSPNARSHVMGFPVDSFTMQEAVESVRRSLRRNGLHHVVAINANKIWLSERNAQLKQIVCDAEFVIPEYAVVWAARVLRRPVRGHIGGVMLMKELLPMLQTERIPTYFLGARPVVVKLLHQYLKSNFPALQVAGLQPGFFEPSQEETIVDSINRSGAQLLFVAMGSPRQEFWIETQRRRLNVKVAMGVGGSFDVIAGIKKDTPDWLRHGGEWAYRLIQDPRNLWKRYLKTNPWFVYRILRERLTADR